MAITLVQKNGANTTGAISATMPAWGVAPTAGNLLLVYCNEFGANLGTWPTHPAGYTAITSTPFSYNSSTLDAYGLYWKIATGGDATPGAIGEGSGTANWTVYTFEFNSPTGWKTTPFDKEVHSVASGTGGVSKASGSTATTSQASELAIAMAALSAAGTALTFSGSYVLATPTTNSGTTWLGWKELTTTGVQSTTASWTTSRASGARIATFMPNVGNAWTFAAISNSGSSSGRVKLGGSKGLTVRGYGVSIPSYIKMSRTRKFGAGMFRTRIIIPGYVYPGAIPRTVWDDWCASAEPVKYIIANPGSPGGPGTFTDTNYQAVIANAQAAGIKILGYVDTSYAHPDVSTPVLDNFNTGASQALTARTGWYSTIPGGYTSYSTDSVPTKAVQAASTSGNWWNTTFTDADSRLKLAGVSATGTDWIRLFNRFDTVGLHGYYADFAMNGAIHIWKSDSSGAVGIGSVLNTGASLAIGDEVCLRSIGPRIEAWYKPSAGVWTFIGVAIDFEFTSGRIGFSTGSLSAALTIDEFGGGAVGASPMSQIDGWKTFYGINDIFFDQTPSDAGNLAYMKTVSDYVRSTSPGSQCMFNAGTTVDEGYAALSDIICTFEGPKTSYDSYVPSAWNSKYEPGKFCHLVYNVADEATMETVVDKAISLGVGYPYAVDTSVWFAQSTFFDAEIAYLRAKTVTSSGIANLNKIKVITVVSTGGSTGVCAIVRARHLIVVSTGTSSGVCRVGRARGCIARSNGSSSGLLTLTRARKFAAVSWYGLGEFILGSSALGVSNSTGIVNLSVSSNVVITISSVSTGSSSGIAALTRIRSFAATSNGTSSGICAVGRKHSCTAISGGNSSGIVTLVRKRGLTSVSNGSSSGLVTIFRTRNNTCISGGSSSGITSLTRTRGFAAISSGSSSGVCSTGRKRNFAATSNGISTGVASTIRTKSLTCVSTGSSSGTCALGRSHSLTCTSTGSSSGISVCIRNRKLIAVGSGSSNGLCAIGRNHGCTASSSGNSIGVTSIIRTRRFAAISSGTSSGTCGVGRTHGLACTSSGSSSGVATLARARKLTIVSTGNSSGICSVGRSHVFACVSGGSSSGICTLTKVGVSAYISTGSSTGVVTLGRARKLFATSTGSSSGNCAIGRQRKFASISTGMSSAQTSLTRARNLSIVSATLSSGIVALSVVNGGRSYLSVGTSTGIARFAIQHSLTAISTGSSNGQAGCTRKRSFGCISTGGSSGIVSIGRTRLFAAISSGSSNGICVVGRKRSYACTSAGFSSGVTGIVRNRKFAAISSGASSGVCTIGRLHNITAISSGSSSGLCSITRQRKIAAISNGISSGTCTAGTVGQHFFNSTGSSSGIARFARTRALFATSSSTSTGQCAVGRKRGSTAISVGTSSGQTGITRTRGCKVYSTGSSSGIWSTSGLRTIFALSVGSSTGRASLARNRLLGAISVGNSSANCKVFRHRNFASLSNGSSRGITTFHLNYGMSANSHTTSSGLVSLVRARKFNVFSNSTSTGIVTLSDAKQYGTVKIFDILSTWIVVYDERLEDITSDSSEKVLVYDR